MRISDWSRRVLFRSPHIHAVWNAAGEIDGPHMVEENERPHHPPFREGQDAPYFEAAQIATTLRDHEVQHASSSSKLSRAYLAAPSTMQLFGGFGNVTSWRQGPLRQVQNAAKRWHRPMLDRKSTV